MELQPKAAEIFLDVKCLNSSSQRFQPNFTSDPMLAFSPARTFRSGGSGHSGGRLSAKDNVYMFYRHRPDRGSPRSYLCGQMLKYQHASLDEAC